MNSTELLVELLKGFYPTRKHARDLSWSYVEETTLGECEGFKTFKSGFCDELEKFRTKHGLRE